MFILGLKVIFSTARNAFKSHKTLETESNSRLIPVKEQLEDIFKRYALNNIKVVIAYVKQFWDSQIGLGGSYLKTQRQVYNKAVEEADKLLRKNGIQSPLIRVTTEKYGSEVVELCPEYINEPHGKDRDVTIFGN